MNISKYQAFIVNNKSELRFILEQLQIANKRWSNGWQITISNAMKKIDEKSIIFLKVNTINRFKQEDYRGLDTILVNPRGKIWFYGNSYEVVKVNEIYEYVAMTKANSESMLSFVSLIMED